MFTGAGRMPFCFPGRSAQPLDVALDPWCSSYGSWGPSTQPMTAARRRAGHGCSGSEPARFPRGWSPSPDPGQLGATDRCAGAGGPTRRSRQAGRPQELVRVAAATPDEVAETANLACSLRTIIRGVQSAGAPPRLLRFRTCLVCPRRRLRSLGIRMAVRPCDLCRTDAMGVAGGCSGATIILLGCG